MELQSAKKISDYLISTIKPYCEPGKCFVAGSVRREVWEVKDIEIVCMPRLKIVEQNNLFGESTGSSRVIDPGFVQAVNSWGAAIKGKISEKYMQIYCGCTGDQINVDLFMPNDDNFFRILAIRTGSADYAHKDIASAWSRLGWCGVDGELYRKTDCYMVSGKWKLKDTVKDPQRPPKWTSEKHFFEWLQIPYIEPKYRSR